jgi:hypothetical protein
MEENKIQHQSGHDKAVNMDHALTEFGTSNLKNANSYSAK